MPNRTLRLFAFLLVLCMAVGMMTPVAFATDLPERTAEGAEDTGVMTVRFSKNNGSTGSPYMSGLNNPAGYYFYLDESRKLLSINVIDFATYSNNTNKGKFSLYQWKGSYDKTVSAKPLYSMDLVNFVDHTDLIMELPADVKVTGELYFEFVCTAGSGYTPWFASGGVTPDVPGVVTGMTAYQGGHSALPFDCQITLADYDSKSPDQFITWLYDFTQDMNGETSNARASQTNQIEYACVEGEYTTFTAGGDDPYFRFDDACSPTVTARELSYIAILYRTTSEIASGEFYTNRSDGRQWGADGTHAVCQYKNDGEWHIALCDASSVWGNTDGVNLYAFRFDPLASGCKAGDTVDIAYLAFFESREWALAFDEKYNGIYGDSRELERRAGTDLFEFGKGQTPAITLDPAVSLFTENGFMRLISDGADGQLAWKLTSNKLSDGIVSIRMACRTEMTGATVTVTSQDRAETARIGSDGWWQTVDLTFDAPVSPDALRFAFSCDKTENVWVDIAYIALFSQSKYADGFVPGRALNNHRYLVGQTDVPVLTCTSSEIGDPYNGPGEFYGQLITADSALSGIVVYNHASWVSGVANSGTFTLWKWNGTYEKTVSGQPAYTQKLSDLKPNVDLIVTFDSMPAGQYYYEVKLTSGGNDAYTGFQPKNGKAIDGNVAYRNGKPNGASLLSAYLTKGIGLVDTGPEYVSYPTVTLDFSQYCETVAGTFQVEALDGCRLPTGIDAGYLTLTSDRAGAGAAFDLSACNASAPLCDAAVIVYRASAGATGKLLAGISADGTSDGQGADIVWNGDGKWHVAVLDARDVWGNLTGETLTKLTVIPDTNLKSGQTVTLDVNEIVLFSDMKTATDYANTLKTSGDLVSEPEKPLNPGEITPLLVLEGEALNVINDNGDTVIAYDYDAGYIRLFANGTDFSAYALQTEGKIGRSVAIKCRTDEQNIRGVLEINRGGSVQTVDVAYVPDGNWHTYCIELGQSSDACDGLTFRFAEPLIDGTAGGGTVDVEYMAFTDSIKEARGYVHALPHVPQNFTAFFIVEGRLVYTVTYKEGAKSISEPVVPLMPGKTGVWEDYTLNGNVDIHAIYTSSVEEPPVGEWQTPGPDAETAEPQTDIPGCDTDDNTDTVGQAGDAATDTAEPGTDDGGNASGCRSSASALFVTALLTAVLPGCAAAFGKRKKPDPTDETKGDDVS